MEGASNSVLYLGQNLNALERTNFVSDKVLQRYHAATIWISYRRNFAPLPNS